MMAVALLFGDYYVMYCLKIDIEKVKKKMR